jgi:hypothetical protein
MTNKEIAKALGLREGAEPTLDNIEQTLQANYTRGFQDGQEIMKGDDLSTERGDPS